MKKPTIFLSSTIYDFSDLRSALKYHLEKQGCVVLASEFNDFRKPLDKHSYDACLSAIERADYFILLIGSRVGGWFDPAKRISITQQEYRSAYARHRQGRLNILTFVRREVWQMREDRKALEKHLAQMGKEAAERDEILAFPNKFATDAAFISDFIYEVGRNHETKAALESGEARPTGNWIHVFDDFSEIVGATQPLILSGLPVDEASFRTALEAELIGLLATCAIKHRGKVYNPRDSIWLMMQKCPITERVKEGSFTPVPAKEWDAYSTVMIGLMGKTFPTVVLPHALTNSTFFAFDPSRGVFEETPVARAIANLIKELRWLNEKNTAENLGLIYEHSPKNRPRDLAIVKLSSVKFALLVHLGYRWGNVLILTEAILHYLQAGQFREPTLFPFSPIDGFDKQLEKDRLTTSEVMDYLTEQRKPRTESK
jgi:hypothetical protein